MLKSVLKKSLIGATAVAVLGLCVFGRDTFSYFRTGCNGVRQMVKSEVPLEFEIQRARTLVDQLVPDIRQSTHAIAEQQVDIEYRKSALAHKEAALAKQKDTILTLRRELQGDSSKFVFASRTYTVDEVNRDLAIRFERFKAAEESLAADRSILQARQQSLSANTARLNGMHEAKKDLEVKLEQLAARVQTVRAAETVSQVAFDDSSLSHARNLIAELNKQIDVKQRALDTQAKFADLIPLGEEVPEDAANLNQQIDEHFGLAIEQQSLAKAK